MRPDELRSHRWYGTDSLRSFSHRARTRQLGLAAEEHLGKPVIGILNTWSELNPCHIHLRDRAEDVKRGVWQAGGYPVELPVMAVGETFQKPTAMLYRNLLAMEAEEVLRSYPIDAAVLMGGCDKTTPALVMGAISADLPAIFVPCGPMIPGDWRGTRLGSGSDMWKYWADRRAGLVSDKDWDEIEDGIEDGIARSPGHCMTMGTASTMTSVAEVLGLSLPGAAAIPAVHSAHSRMAAASGRTAVRLAWEDLRPSAILTPEAYADAVTTILALGGSTNAVIHLIAMARRSGAPLTLDDFDAASRQVPVLADIRPNGSYLMDDFHRAGGLPALLGRIEDLLRLDRPSVGGFETREPYLPEVIRPRGEPLSAEGGLAVLRGNLCPGGAVIKHVAADPRLLKHTGPAVVFDDHQDLMRRIDTVECTAGSVLVLRGSGPRGGPGMPEHGMLPIPERLLKQGVRDMVRISDARMSGTSYGACVLHVAPESHVGGPLALVRDGDPITLDVGNRRLTLEVADAELARRRSEWTPPAPRYTRGYGALYTERILQAGDGCDFDFLLGRGGAPEPEVD